MSFKLKKTVANIEQVTIKGISKQAESDSEAKIEACQRLKNLDQSWNKIFLCLIKS